MPAQMLELLLLLLQLHLQLVLLLHQEPSLCLRFL
jgi:hypothetical protein